MGANQAARASLSTGNIGSSDTGNENKGSNEASSQAEWVEAQDPIVISLGTRIAAVSCRAEEGDHRK